MNVLDLFSGIGGFSLGLERAGMRTVAFCEINPYCRRVLARHWPDVPIFGDVRELTASSLVADATHNGHACWQRRSADGERLVSTVTGTEGRPEGGSGKPRGCGIDLICGGFPCQDISVAGKGAGLGGERSGLWSEYARIIGELRPRYVIVENVAALLGRGLARVLGDLAALGFDAEWHCIPASAVGAPHRRDRIWIVAYPDQPRLSFRDVLAGILRGTGEGYARKDTALGGWWSTEPDVGRVAHGISQRVDRLTALGNAVVPAIPEIIGRAIMNAEHERTYRRAHPVGCAVLER